MIDQVEFWVAPSLERVVLFSVAVFFVVFMVFSVRFAFNRKVKQKAEDELRAKLEQTGLLDRPEEAVVRDLIRRYRVHPQTQILSTLSHYDSIASEEILRIETVPMPLMDRLDRIEYLYSIRLLAFGHEPSVSGIGSVLRVSAPPVEPEPPVIEEPVSAEKAESPEWSALLGGASEVKGE